MTYGTGRACVFYLHARDIFCNSEMQNWLVDKMAGRRFHGPHLGPETEITKSSDKKLSRLLSAKKTGARITIYYKPYKTGAATERDITPKSVFKTRRSESPYVSAYCHLREEDRTFRVDRISFEDSVQVAPKEKPTETVGRKTKCATKGCNNPVDAKQASLYKTICSKCDTIKRNASRAQRKTTVVKKRERGRCATRDCSNVVAIKEKRGGVAVYRKVCSSCHKKRSIGKSRKTADWDKVFKSKCGAAQPQPVSSKQPELMNSGEGVMAEGRLFEKDSRINHEQVAASVEELRKKLLDFSRRNPLIHFSHNERRVGFIRVVDEIPYILLNKLIGGSMEFKALPDIGEEPPDELTHDFELALASAKITDAEYLESVAELGENIEDLEQHEKIERILKDRIRQQLGLPEIQRGGSPNLRTHAAIHGFDPSYSLPDDVVKDKAVEQTDDFIQTLFVKKSLDRRVRNIYSRYKSGIRETGFNVLQMAFGFLEWTEVEHSEKPNISPIILLPVDIQRNKSRSGYRYPILAETGQALLNETLKVVLEERIGLNMPEFADEEPVHIYFKKLESAIAQKTGWKLRRYVTLGFFPFSDISIYKDLDPLEWGEGHVLLGHDLIAKLLHGKDPDPSSSLQEVYDIDALTKAGTAPAIVLNADSSQHSALVEASKGSSMVIQGPPGTGKSQTIANLICSAVAERKSVLFLAEKQPALDVVSARLKEVGLGCLLMEAQRGVGKHKLLESLQERIDTQSNYNESQYKREIGKIKKELEFTDRLKYALSFDTDYCGLTLYELIWKYISLCKRTSEVEISTFGLNKISSMGIEEREEHFSLIERYFEHLQPSIGKQNKVQHFKKLNPNIIAVGDLIGRAKMGLEPLRKLNAALHNVGPNITKASIAQISNLLSIAKSLSSIPRFEECVQKFSFKADIIHHQEDLKILEVVTPELQKFGQPEEFQLDRIDKLLISAPKFGLEELSISSIDAASLRYKEYLGTVGEVEQFFNNVPFRIERTPQNFLDLGSSIQSIDPNDLVYLADNNIKDFDESGVHALERFADKLKKIKQIIASLKSVDMENIVKTHGSVDLSAILSTVTSGGSFAVFSSRFRQARKTLKGIGFDEPNTPALHEKIKKLIQAVELIEDITSDEECEKYSGRFYDGHKTSAVEIGKVSKILKSVVKANTFFHQRFGFELAASNLHVMTNGVASLLSRMDIVVSEASEEVGKNIFALKDWIIKIIEDLERMRIEFQGTGLSEVCSVPLGRLVRSVDTDVVPVGVQNANFIEVCTRMLETRKRVADDALGLGNDSSGVLELLRGIDLLQENLDILKDQFQFLDIKLEAIHEIANLDRGECISLLEDLENALGGLSHTYGISERFWNGSSWNDISFIELSDKLSEMEGWVREEVLADAQRIQIEKDVDDFIDDKFFEKLQSAGINEKSLANDVFELKIVAGILGNYANQNADQLSHMVGAVITQRQRGFRKCDERILKLEADRTKHIGLSRTIPRGVGSGPKRDWSDLSLIENEFVKKRGHLAIRQLIRRAFGALFAMKPVWLMQPEAVSQFVPKQREKFDLLIIDEASQMLPEKAIASIVRSKQAIVVGDNLQMPPSNVFVSGLGDQEEEEEIEAESILDLASQRMGGNTVRLRWHYRSRHPSLIRFSDAKFYDHTLQLFPSPLDRDPSLGVQHIKVDGFFKGQVNLIEAERVLREARECMARYRDQSIGIVTINRSQMDHIKEELDRLADTDPIVQSYFEYWEKELEYPVVKNLERAQGDERDIIIISTVYGPIEEGVPVRNVFPLINTKMGHRRLNVLFTRAKNRVILVTSLKPSDIKVDVDSHRGKRAFRDYIEYAATGRIETGEDLKLEADSDFEVFVAEALKDSGFTATPQVGVSGFRIDIGVGHPDFHNGYIAGIECDGATYHSTASARDRDRIRQDILESLGWKIYRIWSTDWFSNSEKEKQKMLKWLAEVWDRSRKSTELIDVEGLRPVADEKMFAVPKQKGLEEIDKRATSHDPIPSLELEEIVQEMGPSGRQREIDCDGTPIKYYEPEPGIYEIWEDDRKLIGQVERDASSRAKLTSYGEHMAGILTPKYKATLFVPNEILRSHDDIYTALRWLYKEFKRHSLH